jgi:antitoxin VapB
VLAALVHHEVYTCIYIGVEMAVARSRTFRSGNSEAIRLSRDVAFGQDVELVIVRSGDVMTIYPAAMSIPAMIERLRSLPTPPTIERRDDEELPERPGL